MIDYKKLEYAHELIDKIDKATNSVSLLSCSNGIHNLFIDSVPERYICLEDVIERLEKLSSTKSKFKIGQEIWANSTRVLKPDNVWFGAFKGKIVDIIKDTMVISADYCKGTEIICVQENVYATRKELIADYIKKLQGLPDA